MKVHNILILHFLVLILICTLLLSLPISKRKGENVTFLDTLFISTSAVCVTGLAPLDVGKVFTPFGQGILLIFIQLGGLSLASFFIFFSYITTHRLNLFQRKLILSTYSAAIKEDFKPLIFSIVLVSFLIEFIGSILLFTQFIKRHTPLEAIFYSIFHSVSAFCNAGFSLYSENLAFWKDNPFVVFTSSFLIFFGGIGFLVISEIYLKFKAKEKLSLHSLIVLKATFALVVLGMLLFMIFEWGGVLKGMSFFEKFYISFFHSITPRTCGFNLISMDLLKPQTLFLTMFLMFIGTAPGSTGGGIKVTTFVASFLKIFSKIRGENQCRIKNRAISSRSIEMSFYLIFFSLLLCCFIFILILISEGKGNPFDFLLFETLSAFGTVGLSCGITSHLLPFSKLCLIFLMFSGRIGGLVFLSIIQESRKTTGVVYSEENLLVG
ncbi:MAG: potassium transporter TrkG [Thermoanaerobaculia bacterium]